VTSSAAEALAFDGFVRIEESFRTTIGAFDAAYALVEECRRVRGLSSMSIIGDFVLPPLEGAATRDFQTLHFDFGLPLDPKVAQDVGRYAALHIPANVRGVRAITRLVPLIALLGQRSWPSRSELVERLTAYGITHGAWDDDQGYSEGSLARIVEAAAEPASPILPSVKLQPGFLCGMEFDSLSAEVAFFSRYGLRLEGAEVEIALQPGELLVFDNLTMAHGRRGTRQPGELRQRVFGNHLQPAEQREARDDVLTAFRVGDPGFEPGTSSLSGSPD
jgi:Taurine catabolism dioxygenase TauD, TfdA family